MALADSVALDPHKWLYNPIEVACTLVRDPNALRNAFSYRPAYYRFEEDAEGGGLDYFEHGLQNTRGFRALKVWLCLQQAGETVTPDVFARTSILRGGCTTLRPAIQDSRQALEHLSITTLRYRPADVRPNGRGCAYLDSSIASWLRRCRPAEKRRVECRDRRPAVLARVHRELSARRRRTSTRSRRSSCCAGERLHAARSASEPPSTV